MSWSCGVVIFLLISAFPMFFPLFSVFCVLIECPESLIPSLVTTIMLWVDRNGMVFCRSMVDT